MEKQIRVCKNCGHSGDMHSDNECSHIGECYWKLEDGSFCDCKNFEDIPTYCAGCSFNCQASDCDCKCHDRMRDYYRELDKKIKEVVK